MEKKTLPRPPLDKREDFGKILGVAAILTTIAGMLNGVAVVELGSPVGYTSGPCVNLGRFIASGDAAAARIAGVISMYYAGGIIVGLTGSECDALFEGRMSKGMLFTAALLALGVYVKRNLTRPILAMQIWALSQGWTNAISSKFSAGPIRATHTAGGQTDAAISIGQAIIALRDGKTPPSMRKVMLNAICCAGLCLGGYAAGKTHKKWGTLTALVPAAALALTATVLPAVISTSAKEEDECKK